MLKMNSEIHVIVLFFIIHITAKDLVKHQKLDFVRNYEIINIKLNFAEENGADALRRTSSISMEFEADNTNFQLTLYEDHSIISPDVKVYLADENIKLGLKYIPGSTLYEGIVKGEENSVVNGYFYKNAFVGRIKLKKEVYYLESATKYFTDESYKEKVLIYKESDMQLSEYRLKDKREISKKMSLDDFRSINNTRSVNSTNIIKEKNKITCQLELIADHTFVEFMKHDDAEIIDEMLYHMKITDKVFRYTDFDNDLVPDGIGFSIEIIKLFKHNNDSNDVLTNRNLTYMAHLQNLMKSLIQNWCLVIVFSHRDWSQPIEKITSEGICENSENTGNYSYNIVPVTSKMNGFIPRALFSMKVIRGMGMAFGSNYDYINNKTCSPGENTESGNYVMYPHIRNGKKINNWKFSPCSKELITMTVDRKRAKYPNCLKMNLNSKCGNAITEEGEECDCGSSEFCEKLDPCCNPSGTPDECTLRLRTKDFCSPREGDCCNEQCKIISENEKHKCFITTPCRKSVAICNGISPFCPEIPLPDDTPCLGQSHICKSGYCTRDLCKENRLKSCKCSTNNECNICCLDSSKKCLTLKELNISLPIEIYMKISGTGCNNNKGKCLRNGTCSYAEVKNEGRSWWSRNWLFILLFCFFLFLLVFIFQYFKENIPRFSKLQVK